jgi:nucleobase transporter 1/2
MGEMNQPPPPPVGVPPPMGMGMGMQPMMNPPVGAGAMHPPHEQFHHLAYCVHSNPSWGMGSYASLFTPLLFFTLFFF